MGTSPQIPAIDFRPDRKVLPEPGKIDFRPDAPVAQIPAPAPIAPADDLAKYFPPGTADPRAALRQEVTARPPEIPVPEPGVVTEGARQLREMGQVPLIKRLTGRSLQEMIGPHLPVVGEEREVPFTEQAIQARFGIPVQEKAQVGAVTGMAGDSIRIAAGLLDFFGSPEGVIAAAVAATGPLGATVVAGAYGAEQAAATPEAVRRYLDDPTPDNLQQALLTPGFAALLLGGAGKGIEKIRAEPAPKPAEVRPEPRPEPAPEPIVEPEPPLLPPRGVRVPTEGEPPLTPPVEIPVEVPRILPEVAEVPVKPAPPSFLEPVLERPRVSALEGPGAKATGAREQIGTQLHQLTAALKQNVKASDSPAKRVKISQRIADVASGSKESLDRSIVGLKSTTAALFDSYARPPKILDFKEGLKKFQGALQFKSLERRAFSKDMQRAVPDGIRREGITVWLQADGNKATLTEWAKGSRGSRKTGYEAGLDLNPVEQTIANNLRNYFDSVWKEAEEAGVLSSFVEDYVPGLWHKRNNPTAIKMVAAARARELDPNFRFSRKKVFESYFEGEQLGFKPVNKDVGFLVGVYDAALARSVASRAFIRSLSEATAPDGRPVVAISGKGIPIKDVGTRQKAYLIKPRAKAADVGDYRTIDHPALRAWKWTATAKGKEPIYLQGDLVVHPEHFTHLKNVLTTSALRQTRFGRGVLRGVREFKHTLLSFSGFHQAQVAEHALFHKVNPFKPIKIDVNNPVHRKLIESGLMVSEFHGAELFGEGLVSGGLMHKLPLVGKPMAAYTDWLFRDYIPRLKISMGVEALARNRVRYAKKMAMGKLSEAQLYEITANQSNAAFGELNYKMMGRNATKQDVFRLIALAPDFLEARARFVGQAVKPYGREQTAAIARGALWMYVGSRIMNKVLDDDYHWDKPFSVVIDDFEYRLRTIQGDIIHAVTDFNNFVRWRVNPTLIRPAIEFVTERDIFGRKRTLGQQFEDFYKGHVPIPFQRRGADARLLDGLLASVGVHTAPAKTKAERLASDLAREKVPLGVEKPGQRERLQLRAKLTRKLRKDPGDLEARKEKATARREGLLTERDIKTIQRNIKQSRLQVSAKRLGITEILDVWDVASSEEKRELRSILLDKKPLIDQILNVKLRAEIRRRYREAKAERIR